MASDYGSLLALDSFASEASLRVAAYGRALEVCKKMRRPPPAESIASSLVDFVKGERWRLDALDVALKHAGMGSTVETLIEKANEIAAWAKPDVVVESAPADPETPISEITPAGEEPPAPEKSRRQRR